jgi:hypothetical protein
MPPPRLESADSCLLRRHWRGQAKTLAQSQAKCREQHAAEHLV